MRQHYLSPKLTIFESELFRTTSTCLHTDDYLLIVDPNWLPSEVATIRAYCDKHGTDKKKYLLFTHSDYDHIIGYGAFPAYTTIASQRFVDNPERDEQLKQTQNWDDEYYIKRPYPLTYPMIDEPVTSDGITRKFGGDDYAFFQAPGHNYDGLITFNRSQGVLIVGDYLSNIEFPYVYHAFADYRATLDKLEQLLNTETVRFLITGHGDHTSSPKEMHQRLADSRAYLDAIDKSVTGQQPFDFDRFITRYDFPVIMRCFHDKNVALRQAEVTKSSN
jgi:glyoxylase-like metal-dependent hydrolase (beta-lactamase superfamily II)